MNITLSGGPGTGTSTLAKELASRYGYEVRSAGSVLRALAAERGLSVVEAQALAAEDPSVDKAIDSMARCAPSDPASRIVFDSRLGFAFAKGPCLNVKLVCDPEVAARRVLEAGRADEGYTGFAEALSEMSRRHELETRRYKELYGLDMNDPFVFDLVFDTELLAPGEMADIVFREANEMESDTRRGTVDHFRDDGGGHAYFFLSNYCPCSRGVTLDCGGEELTFGSSEAAYQALKFDDRETQQRLAELGADDAKHLAHELNPRADWEEVKVSSMYRVLRAKFAQNPELASRLVQTRGLYLQEGNSWGDNFWGCSEDAADDTPQINMLGRLLMSVRAEISKSRLVPKQQGL